MSPENEPEIDLSDMAGLEDVIDTEKTTEMVQMTRFQVCMQCSKDSWEAVKEVWQAGMQTDDEEEEDSTVSPIWTTIFAIIWVVGFCAAVVAAVVIAIMGMLNLLAFLASLFAAGKPSTPDTGGKPFTPEQTIIDLGKKMEGMKTTHDKAMADKQKNLDDCIETNTKHDKMMKEKQDALDYCTATTTPDSTISDLRSKIASMEDNHRMTLGQKDTSLSDLGSKIASMEDNHKTIIKQKDESLSILKKTTEFCQESFTNQSGRLSKLEKEKSDCDDASNDLTELKYSQIATMETMKYRLDRCISIPDLSSAGLLAATIAGNAVVNLVSANVYTSRYAHTSSVVTCYV